LLLSNQINSSTNDIKTELNILHSEISYLKNQIKSLNSSNLEIEKGIAELKNFLLPTYAFFGIQNNIPISRLTDYGYSYVYNKPYNHATKSSEMDEIKNSCLPTTILCLGGRDSTNDVLLVVSCALCSVVLAKTEKNTPNLHNGAYWYYSPDANGSRSIGFAPNSGINQGNADGIDQFNNQRVSWHLTGSVGGFRLGSLINLDDDTRYYKVILKK
jgi:hypothetical protein